jgi:para-aminobenzoate synthetase / 4-amino-4-deoxychorismate lyase
MNRRHALPAEIYALVEHTPETVLLESRSSGNSKASETPWTQLFLAPLRICAAYTPHEVPGLFEAIESEVAAGHYAAGFFTYECGSCFEPKAATNRLKEGMPLAWFGIYERSYGLDHESGTFVGGEPSELAGIRAKSKHMDSPHPPEPPPEIKAEFALSESDYVRQIAAIHEWIRAGDVYQLNFTAPFRLEAPGSVAAHFARLHARQPVDYGAFLHWRQGRHILSFSPELFFRIDRAGDSRRIVTRPMKGTARRGRTTREDREIAEWLHNDAKNRSENVMIVDLLRNDLGRVAKFGSVQAENLFAVERYPTLWQMTSTVSAELRPETGFRDIFRALFPCGSVTGAPKVRAMQLLAKLESAPRGVYTGAIGFFSPERTVFNVAIRTLELVEGRGSFGAGSGVVIDSDPAEEFRECLLKAQFLAGPAHRTSGAFVVSQPDELFLIETMLWKGAYPLLELHLDRLTDSADYFGFACNRAAIREALEQHARGFADKCARKVRLLLIDADGNFGINSEPLPAADPNRVGRVCFSNSRTDPADPTLYHKTTQRPLYALGYQQAAARGFDDVLFLNLRGEITEGAISNVFIERDGRWFTPPIECGLLAGVFRRHMLETQPKIEERVLTLDDLRNADAVYLTNAVRGLRRVEVVW